MKIYIRTLIFCLLLISLLGNAQLTDHINQLNGDVKKIEEYHDDDIRISHFNQEGFLTSETNISCYTISRNNNLIDICDTSFLSFSYKFDNQGRIVNCRVDASDHDGTEWSYSYEIKYDIDFYKEVFGDDIDKYTMNHIKIEESYQDIEGGMASEYFQYTKDGERLLEEEKFVSHHEDLNDWEHTTIRTYSSSGLLELVDHTDDKTSYLDVYSYDKNQNLIQVKRNFKDTKIVSCVRTYEYIYDKNQNWIKQIYTQIGFDNSMEYHSPFIKERMITYY